MTKYCEYVTGWDAARKGFRADVTEKDFAHVMMKRAFERGDHSGRVLFNQVSAEHAWHASGRPYYKVDDAAVGMFRGVSIDLPFSYLKMPFNVFCVRFSETCSLRTKFGPMRSMLVQWSDFEVMGDTLKKALNPMPHFYVWCDCGERDMVQGYMGPMINYLHMQAAPEMIIGEELGALPLGEEGSALRDSGIEKELVAIALSVAFLATSSDKIIRPDVLSKDMPAYIEAHRKEQHERIRVMTERAQRRGKIGWFVDGERELVHSHQESEPSDPSGRELSYRHVRSAHFRKLENMVVFVRQCVVRPDLPAREMKI